MSQICRIVAERSELTMFWTGTDDAPENYLIVGRDHVTAEVERRYPGWNYGWHSPSRSVGPETSGPKP